MSVGEGEGKQCGRYYKKRFEDWKGILIAKNVIL